MRWVVAITAAVVGFGLMYVGLRDARDTPARAAEAAASDFVTAMLAGETSVMESLLDENSHARLDQFSMPPTDGVTFRIHSAAVDEGRAVVPVNLVSPGDFARGEVHCIRRGERWLILGIVFEEREQPEKVEAALDELREMPGVTVSPLKQ